MNKISKETVLADWLYTQYRKAEGKRKRRMSIIEFARYVGIPQGSMSQYMNEARLPDHNNADKIAAVLGPEVYEILEIPPRMPEDTELMECIYLLYELDEEDRRKIIKEMKKLVEKIRENNEVGELV